MSNEMVYLPPLIPPTEEDEEEHNPDILENYIYKITTFTPDPIAKSNDLICVAIYGDYQQLAYIRPTEDVTWTFVVGMEDVLIEDVVYFNHKFYAITYAGELMCFNVTNPNLKLVAREIPKVDKEYFCQKKYLVEYGELVQIQRFVVHTRSGFDPDTIKFKIFKWHFDGWLETKNLDDAAFFLGDNSSISVLASNFVGCQGNCIYFTQDKDTLPLSLGDCGSRDLGAYNVENGTLTTCFTIDTKIFPRLRKRPIWILPSLDMY
ncbi:hypothetical protein PanWU01x14_261830 [Parasponia andersonii]|uniref:KIB1-4 beta-propeller domain-containing protein n=1 Tax=Parasponia andersonii TaxID=3476 RepID=A0A2P5B8A7_PARAD|nr:hypothetical protein PanWU01x14_261830 [Parasponia andersonii]